MHALLRFPKSIPTLVLTIVFAALAGVPSVPGAAEATLPGKLVPADATLFGAYVKPTSGYSQGDVKAALTRRETQIGRRFDVSHWFYRWGKPFPTWKETWDVQMGRIPLVSWGAANTNEVNSGRYDGYIRARAAAVKKFRAPMFIRWFAEMETGFSSDKAVSPSAYITAWRRIHRIFRSVGATNVVWVWCGTAAGFRHDRAQPFYPGASYVDWVCSDGYNWAPSTDGATWTSFEEIFQGFYDWGSTTGKPLMVAETGTEEDDAPGRKATWIRDASDTIKHRFRNIKAFVYFDAKSTDVYGNPYDWRTDSSSSSLNAFAAMGRDPHFRWNRVYRPDALIGRAGKRLVGNDRYEGEQKVRQRLRRKGRTRFTVSIENDGNIGDVYSVRPGRQGKGLKVRYFLGNRNVTPEVKSGSFLTPELEPGESVVMTLTVRAKRGKIGKAVRLSVISGSERNVADSVLAKVRRGKRRR